MALEHVIASIEQEMRARRADDAPVQTPGADSIPGDSLVEFVGRASVLAPPRTRQVLERCLWPRVRENVAAGAPAVLVRGNYRDCLTMARSALEETARKSRTRERLVPVRMAAFKHAAADPLEQACAATLVARLNAGLFLAGLEALWRDEGLAAARTLWHDGGLAEWDRYLTSRTQAGVLRRVATANPSLLPTELLPASPWLRSLLAIMPKGVPHSASSNLLEAARVGRALLVDGLLSLHLGAERAPDWTVSCPEGMPDPGVVVQGATGSMAGVWVTSGPGDLADDGVVRLPEDWIEMLDGVVLAERIELTVGDDGSEPGENAVEVLRLAGYVDARGLEAAPRASGVIELAWSRFAGGHQCSVEFLAGIVERT